MTTLGGHAKTAAQPLDIQALVASLPAYIPPAPGFVNLAASMQALLYQDDDAHDTCSLTACLSPLHPGPCKGWKGTLFDTAPGAWHSLEAAKVEKANTARLKKIEVLKQAGKPIPHKLLTPIVAKPHPHAGQTANKATGGAHTAGQAVTESAGVKTSTPGKVTLGQAAKTLGPVAKGPKGKKPTLASKGIAHVIAQEKVTPQYKLDKAAAITPEQWAGLSDADKATIRDELAKIKKDGFGPQQKKADELISKFGEHDLKAKIDKAPKAPEVKPAADAAKLAATQEAIAKAAERSAADQAKATNRDTTPIPEAPKAAATLGATAPHHIPKIPGEPLSAKNYTPAMKTATEQAALYANPPKIHALQGTFEERFKAYGKLNAEEWKALPEGTKTTIVKDMIGASAADKQLHQGFIDEDGKAFTPVSAWLTRRNIEVPKLEQNKINKWVPQFAKDKPVKPAVKPVIPEKTTVQVLNKFGTDSMVTKVNHPKYGGQEPTKPPEAATPPAAPKLPKAATPKLADLNAGKTNKGSSDQNGIYNKPHVGGEVSTTSVGLPPGYKLSKDSLGYSLTYKVPGSVFGPKLILTGSDQKSLEKYAQDHHAAVLPILAKHKAAGTSPTFELSKLTPEKVAAHKPEEKAPEAPKGTLAEAAAKPKPLPKHVQDAIAMAKGHAPGASWSKNHLAAYQPLSAEEFDALPKDTQGKIAAELKKGTSKFLDPKKIDAAKKLLAKFGHGDGSTVAPAPPKAAEKAVGFSTHLHDHGVTKTQAAEAVKNASIEHHFIAAKQTAGLTSLENPDSTHHNNDATSAVDQFIDSQTLPYDDGKILDQPQVKAAVGAAAKALHELKIAQSVHKAKTDAFNKVSKKLYADGSPSITDKLSPIEKASLEHYQKHLLNHPVNTDSASMDKLQADAAKAIDDLHVKLQSAQKKANAPKPDDMSPALITDRAKELLGPEADKTKFKPDLGEFLGALAEGKAAAAVEAANYPPEVLNNPAVGAKFDAVHSAAAELAAAQITGDKFFAHLKEHHMQALTKKTDVNGNPLSPDDSKVILAHAEQLKNAALPGGNPIQAAEKKLDEAKAQFQAAADKAKASLPPAEPNKLTDFDQETISNAFQTAWAQQANKVVLHGLKTYAQKADMKSHPEYQPLVQDLTDLKVQAAKVALAHAAENTALLNVPTDPDTGNYELANPEWKIWQNAIASRVSQEQKFSALHKAAQAKLDTIRTSAGLKKRALPKVDAPAVKATAAESGFYQSKKGTGPNFNKLSSAKSYMLAKVGPKLGVVHKTLTDKANEKYGAPAPVATPAKIKDVATGTPVKLGGADSIAHIPDPLKKQITSDFKAMPDGKYLADPAQDIFSNLVNLAAAHGKTIPDGLSVDQVLKTIDETHSKTLGVSNSGMLHKKITDWLGTPTGKTYAEQHSTADAKKVKQLAGEIDLPKGVTLAPGEKVQKLAGPGPHDKSLDGAAFKPLDASQAQQAQDAYMKANGIKWTADQKASIKSYTGSAYHTYNSYLRNDGSGSQSTKQHVINIQAAMIPMPQHTLLKRGTGWPPDLAAYQNDPKALLGKTFEDKAFVSTTVAGSSGHFSGQQLQLLIEAPKGTPAAFVNGISHFKNQENEMLLAAGTKFKVLSVDKTTAGHTLMRVRIVGDK